MKIKPPRETERELKEFWNIDVLKFIAQFAFNRQGKGYFRNVRKPDGNVCVFPDGSDVKIPASNIAPLDTDREYTIHAYVAPDARRKELGIEYLLYLDSINVPPKINKKSPKQYIRLLYQQYQIEGIAKDSLRGAIRRLAVETNKKAETFIYEILQNADDYPDPQKKKVNIRFKIAGNYLVVTHNGQPFRENNVYAICSVATGDKERDINKTGYKGIGFKSIFKHSNFVWIHSGEFSFRFDESFHRTKGDETFWQVIPIWTELEEVDRAISSPDIINAPVTIVIRPKDGFTRLKEYEAIFKKVFRDERVLLFLRAVESLSYQSPTLTFTSEKVSKNWELSELPEVLVPEDVQERINQLIDKGNDERIPEKFKDIESTKITFATRLRDGNIAATENARIYAYLPTDLNFGLPFLINGDFIPDGSRDKLFWDLEWNQYLFKQAGHELVVWLQALYLKHKDVSSINLLPNLERLISEELDEAKKEYLLLFKEGMSAGVKAVSFIPDTKGNLHLLNNLVIDLTGLLGIMGEVLFRQCTGIDEVVMHPSYAAEKIVVELMIEYDLGKEFGKEELLNIIHEDEFKEWLKKPENNIAFLELLNHNNWLLDFSDKCIYLTDDSELEDSWSVYFDLGDDRFLLSWLGVPVLHQKVKRKFKASDLGTLVYNSAEFIDNYILKNQSEIDGKLDITDNNIKFYQYLFKHYENLLDSKFADGQLGYFRVLGYDGKIINSISARSVYLLNDDIRNLAEQKSFPEDQVAMINSRVFASENSLALWTPLWLKFGVKELTDSTLAAFIKDEITSQSNSYFAHFELTENDSDHNALIKGNQLLWIFLKSALNNIPKSEEKEFKEVVSELPVYTKDEGNLYSLKDCYLSKEFTGNDTLENLVDKHSDIQIHFVSDQYLTNKALSTEKWTSLFESFFVKTDVKDLLLHYLIPEINGIGEDNLIAVTQLIFENRTFLKDQLGTLNLKLKTTGGQWLPAADTIIGSHYSENKIENQLLSAVSLDNTISNEYSNAGLKKWFEFFKNMGAGEYQSEQEIISAKIKKFIEEEKPLNDNDEELTFLFVKELVELSIAERLTIQNYETLKSMLLLLRSDENETIYESASQCHFSKEYKPKLNLEQFALSDQNPIIFLSPEYLNKSGNLKDLKSFFKKIGVEEDFFVLETTSKARREIDTEYIKFIDRENSRIKSQAITYAYNHSVKPWRELAYMECLQYPVAATIFWNKIATSERFLKSVFEPSSYHFYYGPVNIPNYIEWFIKNTVSIPAKDGKCYKPSEIYSIKLEKFLKNKSLLPDIDLSDVKHGEKSLEEHLGFKMNITLDLCIERIDKIKDVAKLKKEGIWDMFIRLVEKNKLADSESASLSEFLQTSALPNQLNEWKSLKELYFIKDDFDLGVGNCSHLIHDELKPIAHQLTINGLMKSDFNPDFKDIRNESFKELLISRLKYIALAENSTDWKTKSKELSEIIRAITFQTTNRISFSFKKVNPPIENTEKTFYQENNNVYYVGNWRWARAAELFTYVHKLLKLENISLKILQDILLLSHNEILDFFDEKNIKYPYEWMPEEVGPEADTTSKDEKGADKKKDEKDGLEDKNKKTSANTKFELTDEEITELEALLNRQLSVSEMANTLIIALFRALKHYEANGYNVAAPKANIEECIKKRMLEGIVKIDTKEVKTIIARSAKKGILHLNYNVWDDLNNAQIELFVVTGNNLSDYLIFADQRSLSSINKDSWVAKIGGKDKYVELSSLLNGEYLHPDKKFSPLQFLIRISGEGEYQSIFEGIYSRESTSDFTELD